MAFRKKYRLVCCPTIKSIANWPSELILRVIFRIKAKWYSRNIRRRSSYLNEHPRTEYVTCCVSPFSHGHMAATRVCSSPYPFHSRSWTWSLRVTHELRGRQPQWLCSEFVPFLLLFDCQEAFHCCLVVTCINRINMISIQCHRVGEWWSGKPEFENVSDPAGVYIPFKYNFEKFMIFNSGTDLEGAWGYSPPIIDTKVKQVWGLGLVGVRPDIVHCSTPPPTKILVRPLSGTVGRWR